MKLEAMERLKNLHLTTSTTFLVQNEIMFRTYIWCSAWVCYKNLSKNINAEEHCAFYGHSPLNQSKVNDSMHGIRILAEVYY